MGAARHRGQCCNAQSPEPLFPAGTKEVNMRNLIRSGIFGLVLVSAGTSALPLYKDRFVDAKSGYIVESQEVGSWMKLAGRHPATGSTFRLKVSRHGRVTGLWDGRPVDFVLDDKSADVQLAEAAAADGAK
jgi:hypothetical protein